MVCKHFSWFLLCLFTELLALLCRSILVCYSPAYVVLVLLPVVWKSHPLNHCLIQCCGAFPIFVLFFVALLFLILYLSSPILSPFVFMVCESIFIFLCINIYFLLIPFTKRYLHMLLVPWVGHCVCFSTNTNALIALQSSMSPTVRSPAPAPSF